MGCARRYRRIGDSDVRHGAAGDGCRSAFAQFLRGTPAGAARRSIPIS